MGFWSSIGSAISSGFSSFCSGISSACSAIGSALSSFATGVGTILAGAISALEPVAKALGAFANAFLQGLGILKPNETVEELGDRALQAKDQGITMDKFDNFNDYMSALREFKLDPDASTKLSKAEKMVAGIGVSTVGVEDKFHAERGSLNGMWLLPIANPGYFTPERMQSLVSTGRLGGDILAYLEKRLSGSDASSLEERLEVNADGTPLSSTERDKLYSALDSARDRWAEIGNEIENSHKGGA